MIVQSLDSSFPNAIYKKVQICFTTITTTYIDSSLKIF